MFAAGTPATGETHTLITDTISVRPCWTTLVIWTILCAVARVRDHTAHADMDWVCSYIREGPLVSRNK